MAFFGKRTGSEPNFEGIDHQEENGFFEFQDFNLQLTPHNRKRCNASHDFQGILIQVIPLNFIIEKKVYFGFAVSLRIILKRKKLSLDFRHIILQ